MKKKLLVSTGFAGIAFICAPHLASAQDASGSNKKILEEVVVTAQKRSETLQSIPIAITAATAETLQASGVQSTQDLGLITPSLNMVSAIGYSQPRLRGVGVQGNGPGVENSVATYVDDVYYAAVPAALLSLSNIAQVEILKGPQGTLFGRNASGGVIQVITKDPSNIFGGNASVSYSSYDTRQADFYVTGGVDVLAGDLAVMWTEQGEGYGKNLFTGNDVNRMKNEISARSKWKLEPTSATTLRFVADYVKNDSSMGALRPAPAPGAQPAFSGGAPGPRNEYDVNENVEPYHRLETDGVSLRWDQDISDFQFVSISAYRESTYNYNIDFDLTPVPGIAVPTKQRDRQFSEELQLISPDDDKLTWMTGLYYFRASGKYDPTSSVLGIPGAPDRIDIFANHTTESYAAFAQSTLALAEDTHLTLGARYTYEIRGFSATETVYFPGGFSLQVLPPELQNPDDQTFKKPTWRVSLDHNLNLDTLAYVSYNRGFKSGGFNAGKPDEAPYDPETLDAYEIGLKTAVLDQRLRLNTAVFYYDYTNIQVASFNGGQISLGNGAAAKIYGLDFDFKALLTDQLTISGGFTYLHDRFAKYPNADTYTPLPAGGGSIPSQGDVKGNRLGQTPDVVANLSADYAIEVAGGETTFNLSYVYNDGWFAESENRLKQDAYNLVNASASWASPNKLYTVKVWGRNLTDERVAMQLAASPSGDATAYMPPRTFGVTLRTDF